MVSVSIFRRTLLGYYAGGMPTDLKENWTIQVCNHLLQSLTVGSNSSYYLVAVMDRGDANSRICEAAQLLDINGFKMFNN